MPSRGEAAKEAADKRGYLIHYALKANPDSRLLGVIASVGLGADCVSGGEVKAALDAGVPASKVVFSTQDMPHRRLVILP